MLSDVNIEGMMWTLLIGNRMFDLIHVNQAKDLGISSLYHFVLYNLVFYLSWSVIVALSGHSWFLYHF